MWLKRSIVRVCLMHKYINTVSDARSWRQTVQHNVTVIQYKGLFTFWWSVIKGKTHWCSQWAAANELDSDSNLKFESTTSHQILPDARYNAFILIYFRQIKQLRNGIFSLAIVSGPFLANDRFPSSFFEKITPAHCAVAAVPSRGSTPSWHWLPRREYTKGDDADNDATLSIGLKINPSERPERTSGHGMHSKNNRITATFCMSHLNSF